MRKKNQSLNVIQERLKKNKINIVRNTLKDFQLQWDHAKKIIVNCVVLKQLMNYKFNKEHNVSNSVKMPLRKKRRMMIGKNVLHQPNQALAFTDFVMMLVIWKKDQVEPNNVKLISVRLAVLLCIICFKFLLKIQQLRHVKNSVLQNILMM
jgi:deoxyribodipyrimidine photolyase